MSALELLRYNRAAPFRPFRIRMTSGRTVDVRNPEMVRVGNRDLIVFKFVSDSLDVYDDWDSFSLTLIESISHTKAPAK